MGETADDLLHSKTSHPLGVLSCLTENLSAQSGGSDVSYV